MFAAGCCRKPKSSIKRRDPAVALVQMREYASEAVALAAGRSRSDLDRDRLFRLAVERLLEMIGEAAARIPAEDQARFAEIPWSQIVGLRNRLIHGYDAIDLDILWRIVARDLPALVGHLEKTGRP